MNGNKHFFEVRTRIGLIMEIIVMAPTSVQQESGLNLVVKNQRVREFCDFQHFTIFHELALNNHVYLDIDNVALCMQTTSWLVNHQPKIPPPHRCILCLLPYCETGRIRMAATFDVLCVCLNCLATVWILHIVMCLDFDCNKKYKIIIIKLH